MWLEVGAVEVLALVWQVPKYPRTFKPAEVGRETTVPNSHVPADGLQQLTSTETLLVVHINLL